MQTASLFLLLPLFQILKFLSTTDSFIHSLLFTETEPRFSSRNIFMALFILFLAISFVLHGALGELVCEELPVEMCSFAISSYGNRCLLETYWKRDGSTEYQCKTSQVMVNDIKEHIETDECITACGLDRNSVGISSDNLLDLDFTPKLCSPHCSQHCPNIADLYHNLAIAEGVNLKNLCETLRTSPRRAMTQVLSSGAASEPATTAPPVAAQGPVSPGAPGSIGAPVPPPL